VSTRKIVAGEWVVVCDGRKALILKNKGDAKFPNLRTLETHQHSDLSTHEQGAGPPGRSYQSVGRARSAMSQTDWHDEGERAFLKSLTNRLEKAVRTGETKAISMIASPRALGMLRSQCSAAVRNIITREIGKDFVKAPIHEIERLICEPQNG
jgi:protein required for attachment to host cells